MGKQQKSKAIAFTFRPFLATFSIFHQWIKNSKKVKGIALLFCCFLAISKVAKNGRKVKGIALLFCCFLATYEKWKKSLKMDEK